MPARFNWYSKYNFLPGFETMFSTWAFPVRLEDIVTPSIRVVTLSISFIKSEDLWVLALFVSSRWAVSMTVIKFSLTKMRVGSNFCPLIQVRNPRQV